MSVPFATPRLPETLTCHSAAVCRQGTARPENQDAWLVDDVEGMYVIADGVGGAAGSELASALACGQIFSVFETAMAEHADDKRHSSIVFCIREAFRRADRRIAAERKLDEHLRFMASTAMFAFVDSSGETFGDDEGRLYIANAGDSRILLLRDGTASQLSHEHTIAQGLYEAGLITCDGAEHHPGRNVLYMNLGGSLYDGPDVDWIDVRAADQIVLMTDGVWSKLTNAEVAMIVAESFNPQAAAQQLVAEAVQRGSGDDVTCVVVDLQSAMEDDEPMHEFAEGDEEMLVTIF